MEKLDVERFGFCIKSVQNIGKKNTSSCFLSWVDKKSSAYNEDY